MPTLDELVAIARAVHPVGVAEDDPAYADHPALAEQAARRAAAFAAPEAWEELLGTLRRAHGREAVWDWTQPDGTCCRHLRLGLDAGTDDELHELHVAVSFVAPVYLMYASVTPVEDDGFGVPTVGPPNDDEVADTIATQVEEALGVDALALVDAREPLPDVGVRGRPYGEARLADALFTSNPV